MTECVNCAEHKARREQAEARAGEMEARYDRLTLTVAQMDAEIGRLKAGVPPGVWIVIDEDRHAGVQAFPFTSEQRAIGYARELAGIGSAACGEEISEGVSDPEDDDALGEKELTSANREDGWVFLARYSTEGDSVRVVKRQMDAAG
jgi:hypothetical protein